MRWSARAALLLLLSSPETALSQPVVTNVGIDTFPSFVFDGNVVAFPSSEARSGMTDFNGDGDAIDFVLHTYNANTGVLTNIGVESSGYLQISEGFVAWVTFELLTGMTDQNGDGDANDRVLYVMDTATGTVTNLGLATNCQNTAVMRECLLDGSTLAFVVDEAAQGGQDLNGDGDALDDVLHVYDFTTGVVTNVGLDALGGFDVDSGRIAFGVRESAQGGMDLDGDSDASDIVVHLYDGSLPAANLGIASESLAIDLDGDLLAIGVPENGTGVVDLNVDGDTADTVVHAFDLQTSNVTNLGWAVSGPTDFQAGGGLIAAAVSEQAQGMDLNGDMEDFDDVIHVFDVSDGSITNLGYAIDAFQLDGSHLAFAVNEIGQNFTDLNGDGDFIDVILHLFDGTTATTTNLLTDASMGFKLDGDMLLAFAASETNQGGTDQNGDGDADDATLYVFDIESGNLINVNADPIGAFQTFQLDGKAVSFAIDESRQGPADLNGDTDTQDTVLHLFDSETGITTNLGLDAGLGHRFEGGRIAFIVREQNQGMMDLNGDGDALDFVLHVTDVTPPLSPVEMIDALIVHVQSLGLPRRIERSRVVILRLARRALERGRTRLAIRFLRIFRFSVRIRAGHGIPRDDARALIEEATEIIQLLRR